MAHSVDKHGAALLAFAVLVVLASARTGYADEAPAATDRLSAIRLAQAGDRKSTPGGILSEVRLGVMEHDVGFFTRSTEDGVDLDLELLFASPDVLEIILSPRPHLGVSVNTAGDTSQLYGGLAWDWAFWGPFFVEGSLALSLHDGELSDDTTVGRKDLGCRVLFRESASLGVDFLERHRLMVTVAHISNAGICDENAGLETFGVRYGFRF